MSRFLLVGPAKIGKSVAANRIANALGCAHIKYEWDGLEALPDNVLAITNKYSWGDISDMALFSVETPEALQALVEALEHQPVTAAQFQAAKKLAEAAAWLDGCKKQLLRTEHKTAAEHVETLHDIAMSLAQDQVARIYSPENAHADAVGDLRRNRLPQPEGEQP